MWTAYDVANATAAPDRTDPAASAKDAAAVDATGLAVDAKDLAVLAAAGNAN